MDFLTINDNEYMGLNNQICEDPVYFCKSHKIYLSEEDAKCKGCFAKWDLEHIERKKCNALVKKEDYEKEQEKYTYKERNKQAKNVRREQKRKLKGYAKEPKSLYAGF